MIICETVNIQLRISFTRIKILPSVLNQSFYFVKEDFNRTPIIFNGRILQKTSPKFSWDSYEFTVQVEQAFKGTLVGAHIKVITWKQESMCGIGQVSIGSRWQIWMDGNGMTSLCSRTTSNINENQLELQQLANQYV
ncbi:unnamed protein product [Rotaria sp. Silwood2]|nr:unnamed protein product [Rotaria sp. Silwood2]CAF3208879.1 unnamed protein product [Rotaria sp. Silwood2]CAF3294596.1 unnamed protein product [Rotaria sp. Silwood2]CAF3362927.1 unnamed protein product [Rotaria sp. Silwood2]CAF4479616.1 unnamed protein product [Rotaria sp. Silwood2]